MQSKLSRTLSIKQSSTDLKLIAFIDIEVLFKDFW